MNKFLKTTTALLTLSALVACGEDAAMEESLNLSNGKTLERISITGKDFQIDGATRSSVVIDHNGVNFLWAANDTVGIFPNSGSQAEFAMEEGVGMQTATFNGGGWALKHSATYSAYYPYNFYNRDLTKIPVKYEGQTQDGNAATSHLGAYDYMAASVATPSNGAVAFDMQHMGALVMLQTNLDEAKTLTSVALKANADVFTTTGTMDLSVVNPAITTTSTTNTFTIALSNFTVAENETSTIYFMLAPTNLVGETLEITLSDEDGEYIKYEVAGKNFVAGTAYAYTLTDGKKQNLTYNLVDLGLPSGTLWADRNVGADSPEAYGDYFAWGEIEPKSNYVWSTYKWSNGNTSSMTKYFIGSSAPADNKTVLDFEDDAAYANMGEEWCMPTAAEQKELLSECTWELTTQNGVKGYKVTGPNGNNIFLPASGFYNGISISNAGSYGGYWASSLDENRSNCAYQIYYNSSNLNWFCTDRYYGLSVRAVAVAKKETAPKVNKVDLGLPSGTLWADRNVGADSPEAYGDYFAWGEVTPKSEYSWNTYKWSGNVYDTQIKYCTNSSFGTVDGKSVLDLEDDAAYVNMGSEWRMPTNTELQELIDNCTWTWTTQNGVNGYKVTGNNGNSIFLPAAGFLTYSEYSLVGSDGNYWLSTLKENYSYLACILSFSYRYEEIFGEVINYYQCDANSRNHGHSVRAVVRIQ